MRIVDWYIGRTILTHSLLVMGVLLGLFTFVALIDQLEDVGVGSYNLYELIKYIMLTMPRRVYELFPMAALLGTILGLSSMAVESELVVMRASGISLLQIVGSVVKVGAVFVILAVLIGEFLTPTFETMAQRGRAEALRQSIKQQTDYGLWMRDQTNFINVGEVLPDLTLRNVRVFEFDDKKNLRSVVQARTGWFDQGKWRLTNVRQSLFEGNKVRAIKVKAAYWESALVPEILSVFLVKPEQLSAWHLYQYITHLRENSQETGRYELAFWHKIILPFATAVMVILAIPFVFRQVRSGGLGQSLFIGIMLGLGVFLANRGFGSFVLVYGIHPLVGALAPTVVFFIVALIMLRRIA